MGLGARLHPSSEFYRWTKLTFPQKLGDSLPAWGQLLSDIRQARTTFDTTDTRKSFGICVIDYANAQSKVNAKYDAWQRELLTHYGGKLGMAMKDTYAAILKGRSDLETLSIEGSSTAQAVSFITFVQDLKRKVQVWGPDLEEFVSGQRTLERQRYAFSADWLYADQIQGEWSAFSDILKRKDDSIQEQVAGLQLKIVAEDKVVDQRVRDFISEWETSKPLQGNIKADTAINTLNVFEGRLNRLLEEYDLVCRAKDALNLEHSKDDRLQPVTEEVRDLKAVWTALSGIWSRLGQLRETVWSAVQVSWKLAFQADSFSPAKSAPSSMASSTRPERCQVGCDNTPLSSLCRTRFATSSRPTSWSASSSQKPSEGGIGQSYTRPCACLQATKHRA